MANPELNDLLDALLPFAQQRLADEGQFYPFGAALTNASEIESGGAFDGDPRGASADDLVATMTTSYRERAGTGKIRAAAICLDVSVQTTDLPQPTDAICVGLEHEDGDSVNVYLPYRKGEDGQLEFAEEVFATSRSPEFFIKHAEAS